MAKFDSGSPDVSGNRPPPPRRRGYRPAQTDKAGCLLPMPDCPDRRHRSAHPGSPPHGPPAPPGAPGAGRDRADEGVRGLPDAAVHVIKKTVFLYN